MSSLRQYIIALVQFERQRQHEDVDSRCAALLQQLLDLCAGAEQPAAFVALKVAADRLQISERSIIRTVRRHPACGDVDATGRWMIDCAGVERARAADHQRRSKYHRSADCAGGMPNAPRDGGACSDALCIPELIVEHKL